MRNSILIIPLLMLYNTVISQVHGGIEQYSYAGHKRSTTVVPRAYFQNEKNWYGEVRYNYDEVETFSINAGKTFSRQNDIYYAITPMAGVMAGKSKGGLLGLNFESQYEKIFFSAESQYTFSARGRNAGFFFNWSEIGYQLTGAMFTGLALQVTHLYKTSNYWEPGIMVGFSFNNFTFPLFVFNPGSSNRYFVLGINLEWGGASGENNQLKCFSFR